MLISIILHTYKYINNHIELSNIKIRPIGPHNDLLTKVKERTFVLSCMSQHQFDVESNISWYRKEHNKRVLMKYLITYMNGLTSILVNPCMRMTNDRIKRINIVRKYILYNM